MSVTTANGRVPEDPDNFLFHYTDGHGLLGILKDKAIWATDAMFLNDRNELLHFAPDVLDALLARIQELRASPQEKAGVSIETIDTPTLESAQFQLASSAQRTIERFKESPLESRFHVHVACFCEGGDILSQWRGYASNKGYAIAVKPQSLQSMVVNPGPSGMGGVYDGFSPVVRLDMVRYGSAEARADIASLLNGLVPPDSISDRGVPSLRGQWNGIETLALVKHPAFKEERERRIVFVFDDNLRNNPQLRFRAHPSFGTVPYFELPLTSEAAPLSAALAGIVIGPGGNKYLRESGLRRLLTSCSLSDLEIWHSDAPFRG